MFKNIKIKYTILFLLLIIILASSFGVIAYIRYTRTVTATVVDIAGRNRMLSQKMAFLAEQIVRKGDSNSGMKMLQWELKEAADLHDDSFYALAYGGTVDGTGGKPLPAAPKAVLPVFQSNEALWKTYEQNARVIQVSTSTQSNEVKTALTFMEQNAGSVLSNNNDIVKAFVVWDITFRGFFSQTLLALATINILILLLWLYETLKDLRRLNSSE